MFFGECGRVWSIYNNLQGGGKMAKEQLDSIKLNDILGLKKEELSHTVVRMNKDSGTYHPIKLFVHKPSELLRGQFWNYASFFNIFEKDDIAIGLARMEDNADHWLLFDISRVTEILLDGDGKRVKDCVGYTYEPLLQYKKYIGRTILHYHSTASSSKELVKKPGNENFSIDEVEVVQILRNVYDIGNEFPGFENVRLSFDDLKYIIDNEKPEWKSAMENQKAIYLIADKSNAKKYVGGTYGADMLWGRWRDYSNNGHGGDVELKKLESNYIHENFQFTVLETFKSKVDDPTIYERENWWKETLMSRLPHGYNAN
jgi:hypothetical protein